MADDKIIRVEGEQAVERQLVDNPGPDDVNPAELSGGKWICSFSHENEPTGRATDHHATSAFFTRGIVARTEDSPDCSRERLPWRLHAFTVNWIGLGAPVCTTEAGNGVYLRIQHALRGVFRAGARRSGKAG
jgi:hypothetical protein